MKPHRIPRAPLRRLGTTAATGRRAPGGLIEASPDLFDFIDIAEAKKRARLNTGIVVHWVVKQSRKGGK